MSIRRRQLDSSMWYLANGTDTYDIHATLDNWNALCKALVIGNRLGVFDTVEIIPADGGVWVGNTGPECHRVRIYASMMQPFIQAVREIIVWEKSHESRHDAELTRHVEILRDALNVAWKGLHSYTRLSILGRVATGSAIQNTQRVMAEIQEVFQATKPKGEKT